MKEKGWSEMDTCLICGSYIPEGRQVCPYCERKNHLTSDQITKKKPSISRRGKKCRYFTAPLKSAECL